MQVCRKAEVLKGDGVETINGRLEGQKDAEHSAELGPWPAFSLVARAVNVNALEGVDASGAKSTEHAEEAIEEALHLTAPGECVRFIYSSAGDGEASFEVRGTVPQGPVDSLAERAALFEERVLLGLDVADSPFQFERSPVGTEDAPAAYGWRVHIKGPAFPALTLNRRRIGFMQGAPAKAEGVWLSPVSGKGITGARHLGRILMHAGLPIEIQVHVRSVALDSCCRETLTKLWRARPGEAGPVPQPDSAPGRGHTLEAVARTLELWQNVERATGISVVVTAARPVPTAVLDAIRAAFYGAGSAMREEPTGAGQAGAQSVQDLRGCIPAGQPLPGFLPDASFLASSKQRHIFSSPPNRVAREGIRLGSARGGYGETVIRLGALERGRHLYIVGATGTGKSTLLSNLIAQDLAAGEGVCVIDPHGDLITDVLRSYPRSRKRDLILVNCADEKRAPGINLLSQSEEASETEINRAIGEILAIFKALYVEEFQGPIFELYMRNALLLLMSDSIEKFTLLDLSRVFEDAAFRKRLVERSSLPWVQDFWQNTAQRTSGEASLVNITAYITSKFNHLVYSPAIRDIIGQPETTIDFCDAIQKRRVILVNLAKGTLGELDARLLGMTLLARFYTAVLARGNQARETRTPFYLYVDEFHQFCTDTFASMLSESRKFGLGITMANQNLQQLEAHRGLTNLLDAALGNAGSLVTFRVGAADALRLAQYTHPEVGSQALQYLPDHYAVAKLLVDLAPTRPFVFKTDTPSEGKVSKSTLAAISESQQRYTRLRATIDTYLRKRRTEL